MWCGSLRPLRNTRVGTLELGAFVVGEAGDGRARLRAVHEHPALEGLDELPRVEREEAVAVRRVALEHARPLGELDDRFHPAAPRDADRLAAVVHAEQHRAVHAARDPEHRELRGHVGMLRRGEQRDAGAAGTADDHRRRQVERAQQSGELVGLHLRLRRAREAHVGGAGVGPVPDHDALPVRRERLRELADPGLVLAETAAGCDDPRRTVVTDDLVGDRRPVDLGRRHRCPPVEPRPP